jgi:hypothetical protein
MPGINPVPLVTRGFGPNPRVVTTGYGPIIRRVLEAIKVYGGKGAAAIRRLPEILWTVYARLASVNSRDLLSGAEGMDRRVVDPNLPDPQVEADLESAGINRRPSGIVIVAEHVRHGKKEGLK